MITTIMGYSFDTWCDIYCLFVHKTEKQPKDLGELRKWWQQNTPMTPQSYLDLGLALIEARCVALDPVIEMLDRVMTATKQHQQSA